MKIVQARKISQALFLSLFVWFCFVSDLGARFWHLPGWPVNLFLNADPLVAFGTVLSSGTLHIGLISGVAILVATVFFGRFFCGWFCPFGAWHQIISHLYWRKRKASERIKAERYSKWQRAKYVILFVFLGMAAAGGEGTLLTGLLDPIPLFTRSFNMVMLPAVKYFKSGSFERGYDFTLGLLIVFAAFSLLNLVRPRFFCKFICPTGALLGTFSRFSLLRVEKIQDECRMCGLCEKNCHGSASPQTATRLSECMLCFNCRRACPDDCIGYLPAGAGKDAPAPDISRRGVLISLAGGLTAAPVLRASRKIAGDNHDNSIIRPPGSLPEKQFLDRCLKCGQCMRICPSNVIQPASVGKGFEMMWTPVLNNRIGKSGCQLNCTMCGHICPTGAIKPMMLDEKQGTGEFEEFGPVKIGTAFVDRSRCLPWAMNKPCIVCQENCPVSPKSIYTIDEYERVRRYNYSVTAGQFEDGRTVLTLDSEIGSGYATGDYYILAAGSRYQITDCAGTVAKVNGKVTGLKSGDNVELQVRLQKPAVDIEKCIGCGICEHECPVSGKRGIRVSSEGESRDESSRLLLSSSGQSSNRRRKRGGRGN